MVTKKHTVEIDDELEKKRREFQDEIAHSVKPRRHKKAGKKRLTIGMILLGVLLAGLGFAAAYALWFNPERAVSDAIVRALSSQTVSFNGTLEAGNAANVQFSGAVAGSDGAKVTFNARIDANNTTERFASDVVMDKDGNVYMSAGGIKNALGDELVADAANEGSYANMLLRKIEGRWLRITSEQLQPYNMKYANIQSCIQSIIQKNQGTGSIFGEAAELYRRDRFIIVEKTLGNRGTSTGYSVHIDQEKLKAFLVNFKGTLLYRQFHDCDSGTFELDPEKVVARIGKNAKLELWINQAHEITEIKANTHLASLATEIRIMPQFNQAVKIIAPSSTINLSQLHEYLADGTQALSLAKQPDTASKQLLDALKAKLEASQL